MPEKDTYRRFEIHSSSERAHASVKEYKYTLFPVSYLLRISDPVLSVNTPGDFSEFPCE